MRRFRVRFGRTEAQMDARPQRAAVPINNLLFMSKLTLAPRVAARRGFITAHIPVIRCTLGPGTRYNAGHLHTEKRGARSSPLPPNC